MDLSHILNSKKIKLSFFLAVFSVFFVVKAFASQDSSRQEKVVNPKQDTYDPTVVILEHIADSHYWHLWGETAIPLPVILYTNKGLETFSSAHFGHGDEAYAGKYYTYKLFNDKVKAVDQSGKIDEAATKKVYDFSITKNVIALWLSCILLLLIFFSVASSYKKTHGKAPRGFQSFIEPVIVFVRDEQLDMNASIPSNGIIDGTLNQNHIVAGLTYLPIRNVAIKGDVRIVHTGDQNPNLIINPNPTALPYQPNYNLVNLGVAFSF